MNYCFNEDFINVNYCIENCALEIKLIDSYYANNYENYKKVYADKKFQFKASKFCLVNNE